MTLNQLRYFQMLAHTQHYHRAAEKLFISQPSLSRAISQLEGELGVKLFEKSGRNVVLTGAGAVFLRQVDQILEQLDRAVSEVKHCSAESEEISIGCILPALIPFLSPMLESYQKSTRTTVHYQTTTGVSEDLLSDLLAGDCDLVFCSRVRSMKKVSFTPVCRLPFYVAVRRDSPFAERAGVRPEELDGCPMLFTRACAYSDMIRDMLDGFGVRPVITGYSNEETGLLGMVEAGTGIFITTDYPQVHSRNTVLVPLLQERYHRTICLAVRSDRDSLPAARALIRFCLGKAGSP